jgi:hypothetical protein
MCDAPFILWELNVVGQRYRAVLEVDIADEARAYAADRIAAQVSPRAVQKTATDELAALLPVLRRLPRRFDRVTGALEQGRHPRCAASKLACERPSA